MNDAQICCLAQQKIFFTGDMIYKTRDFTGDMIYKTKDAGLLQLFVTPSCLSQPGGTESALSFQNCHLLAFLLYL